jgi:hypothetical protein
MTVTPNQNNRWKPIDHAAVLRTNDQGTNPSGNLCNLKPTRADESILAFVDTWYGAIDLQTRNIREELFKTNGSADPSKSWVYTLRNDVDHLPITLVRLNPNGVLSIAGVTSNTAFIAPGSGDFYLTFEYEFPTNSPLPGGSRSARELRHLTKRTAKLLKKTQLTRLEACEVLEA